MGFLPTMNNNRGLGRNFFNDDFFDSMMDTRRMIKTDIRETDNVYILDAELPGFNKEDINIDYSNNVLTIAANKETTNEEKDEKEGTYIRRERSSQSFSRQFLVEHIKHEDIDASFENGVLTVTMPKAADKETNSHRIEIN
jgi:HSP20 family protein